MAGALYIWLIGACFLIVVAVILLITAVFYIGHWLDKRKGATHGFLEMPAELREPAADSKTEENHQDTRAPRD